MLTSDYYILAINCYETVYSYNQFILVEIKIYVYTKVTTVKFSDVIFELIILNFCLKCVCFACFQANCYTKCPKRCCPEI